MVNSRLTYLITIPHLHLRIGERRELMMQINFYSLDQDTEKRRALAKVYSLLIKLAEDIETASPETCQNEEDAVPSQQNTPSGQ